MMCIRPLKTACLLLGMLSVTASLAQSLDVDRRGNGWQAQPPLDRAGSHAAEIDVRGYHFRGDPVAPGNAWRTPDGQSSYRFRPLSEQEKARQVYTPD